MSLFHHSTQRRQQNVRLGLEALEDRSVPTVTAMMSGTELVVTGDGAGNDIGLDRANGQVLVSYPNAAGDMEAHPFAESGITSIRIDSLGGMDHIDIQRTAPGMPVTVETGSEM